MGNGVVPVVFNSFAAIPDIIDSDVNGILIPPFNKEIFINRLSALMQNRNEINRLAQNALKKAQEFSQSTIWAKWNKLLEE